MLSNSSVSQGFDTLALAQPILNALNSVGYSKPSPIQSQTIPHLLDGKDVLGQAQTGTGKTAAFALPLLSRIELSGKDPQVLVLAPTRELAIQVAEAFKRYAAFMPGFEVLAIYGGQDYGTQIRQLKKGVHVVVGTPGRVMDHMRRGTLVLDNLRALVLDEADEMLRMGFIEDVEWVLEQTPETKQVALFSATMPPAIRRIAQTYLNKPEEITIQKSVNTAESIRQRVMIMQGINKFDSLTRILESEPFDGMIIFVRTKTATVELAEDLGGLGYAAAALNGDIPQAQRERTIDHLKQGKLNIVVATDVAARGIDVERVSHVINYDIPFNTEAYVHRIGRTGRAGRTGDAILFVNSRERHLLRDIERATKSKIEPMELPSVKAINEKRIQAFYSSINDVASHKDKEFFASLLKDLQKQNQTSMEDIAASLACLLYKDKPLLLSEKVSKERSHVDTKFTKQRERGASDSFDRKQKPVKKERKLPSRKPEEGMQRYRLEVGKNHGVKAGNIVGAIANEAGLESEFIQQITIHDDYSMVDLPEGMPKGVFRDLRKAWVCGKQLNISAVDGSMEEKKVARKPKLKIKKKTH